MEKWFVTSILEKSLFVSTLTTRMWNKK